MKFSFQLLRNIAFSLVLLPLYSCYFIPSEVLIRSNAVGVIKVPARRAVDASLGDSRRTMVLPGGGIISLRVEQRSNSSCGEDFGIARYNSQLQMEWAIPVLLECWREKFLGVTTDGRSVNVFTMQAIASDTNSALLTNATQIKVTRFDAANGRPVSDSIIFKKEGNAQVQYEASYADSLLLVYYYETESVDNNAGTANALLINNSASIVSTTQIPFTKKTLPLKVDNQGNVFALTMTDDALLDVSSPHIVKLSAVRRGPGSAGSRTLSFDLPLYPWVEQEAKMNNTTMRWYDYSITPDHDLIFTAQSEYDNKVGGITAALFKFSSDTVFKTIDFAPRDPKDVVNAKRSWNFFKNNKIVGKHHMQNGHTIVVFENLEVNYYSHSESSGSYTNFYRTGPYETYGTHLVVAFDEKGNIVWKTFVDRNITPGPEDYASKQEASAGTLVVGNDLKLFYRDRGSRNGFSGFTINLADGSQQRLDVPIVMENYGNGILLEQRKTIVLPDGKAIFFTKNWQTETYGDILGIDFTKIPVIED
ncbi:MAG: hypothetical protein V4642_06495 [Bacteroidota bacterium]